MLWLYRLFSLVCLVSAVLALSWAVLPQQAEAQIVSVRDASVEVRLSKAVDEAINVTWTAVAGTAAVQDPNSDLAVNQDITGTAPAVAVDIDTLDDERVEGSEAFTVTLTEPSATPLPDGVKFGDQTATATITDNDMATVSIAPEADSQTEGDSFAFQVRLSKTLDEAVRVTWTAVAGTAAVQDPNSDLAENQDITGTATFAAGTTTAVAIDIATLDDERVEGSEAFTVTLTGPSATPLPDGVEFGTRTATATITDNDMATVSIAPEADTQAEGDPFTFQVRLSKALDEAVRVTWTAIAGTAAVRDPNSDLAVNQDITGTATFAAGTTTAVAVDIDTLDDDVVEGDETFTVTLTEPRATPLPDGVEFATSSATATITDNDMATVSIAPEADSQTEGNPFAFQVRLSKAVDAAVRVTWTAIAGTAAVQDPNSDLAENQDITGTAIFAAGTTTAFIVDIATLDDERVEGDETFTVTLTEPSATPLPDGVEFGTRTATATITDNDMATVSIAPEADSQTEGNPFAFQVRLSKAVDAAVRVTWTAIAGTAAVQDPNSDLAVNQDITGTATFAAGTTTAVAVDIDTLDDERVEGDETFTVTLTEPRATPLPDGVEFATSSATATITDNDMATVSIAPEADTQAEGDPFAFEVRLSKAVDEAVRVTWTAIADTAAVRDPNSDLAVNQDITGTATFAAGTTTAVIVDIATLDDDVVEGDETFTVTLTEPRATPLPDGVEFATSSATATITDNDMATVSIAPEADSQTEGNPFAFQVRLSKAVDAAVRVTWTAIAGTAAVQDPNSDLAVNQDITGTATFAAGTTTAVAVDIDTLDDDVVEGGETFTVTLTEPRATPLPDGVEFGTRTATATITDNDMATVSITPEADSQTEGNPFAFQVRLSKAVDAAVRVTWTAIAGTAAVQDPNSDLAVNQDITGTATFAAGTTTAVAVDIDTLDDDVVEGDETFTVTLTEPRATPLPDGVEFATSSATATITDNDMATVSIAPEADTQTEGDPFAFEVRLSKAVDAAVRVTWTAVAGTAAVQDPNSDLAVNQDITGTATFAAGTTTAVAVDIDTLDDDVVEGDETFTVTLTEPRATPLPNGVDFGDQTATATITDNDMATVSIAPEADSQAEGDLFAFEVRLSKAVDAAVRVTWTAIAGTAAVQDPNSDLAVNQDITGTATFAAGTTTAVAVDIATLDDERVEGSEVFTVTLTEPRATPLPDGVEFATSSATATITDNDMATVSIAPEADSQAEGDPFAFEVRLSKAVDAAVRVTWTAIADTAAVQDPNSDLAVNQDITGTATFAAGTTAAVIVDIATLDDDVVEGDETFTVTLTEPRATPLPGGVEFGTKTATATITDNDMATVSIAPEADSQTEGDPFAFEVRLSKAVDAAVRVTWTAIADTAAVQDPNSDLAVNQDITGTAIFAAGTTTAVIVDIATLDDDVVEGDETFTVTLTEPSAIPLPDGVDFGTKTATATITDNDMATVSIAPEADSQAEGDPFAFQVRLSKAVDAAVRVTWTAIAGTAAVQDPNSDLAVNQDITGTATFAAGTTTAVAVDIATLDDDVVEGDETFTVTLTEPRATPLPDGVGFATSSATATITDNDMATVSIAPEADTQAEGDPFAFEVRLSKAVDAAVRVTWTAVAGTAAVQDPNSDLAVNQDITGTATFAAGTTTAVAVDIDTLDDDVVEGDETFTVTLTEPRATPLPDRVEFGTRTATATITDNDMATVSIAPEADSQTEGNPFAFQVRLSKAVDAAVRVTWTAVAGTAAVQDPNSDLAVNQDITGTAIFAAGTTTAVAVDIDTLDDERVEGDETFTVTLTEPRAIPLPDGVDFGTKTATATITDNDMATVSIAPEADTQAEGDPFAFEVRLSKAVDAAVRVTWTAVAGTAAVQDPNSDLAENQDITGTAIFAAGTTTAFIVDIATLDDERVEGDETFTVTLTEPSAIPLPDGVDFGTKTATATITDNDMATVSIAPEADSQTEGNPFAFQVRLSKAVDAAVRVTWTAIAGTAAVQDPNSDLAENQDITGTATFAAGTTTAVAVDIDTLDDDVVEGDETFTVTLTEPRATPLPDGVEFATSSATATITDNDMATVSIAPEADTQAEGDPFAFEVRLSKAVDAAVRVTWTAVAGTAAVQDPNSDLAVNQDITGTATFAAGTTTAVAVDIATLDDDVVEGDETFTVTLTEPRATPLPDGVEFATSSATATITDNDMATVSIAPEADSQTEGNPFAFQVRLSKAVDAAVRVTWTAVAGTAAVQDPNSDLAVNQDITGTAIFAAGTTTAVIVDIATLDDERVEGDETFTVTLTEPRATPLPDGVEFGTRTATATITDNDMATVSITPEADSQTEGDPFAFEVRLSKAVDEAVRVTWTAIAETAAVRDPNSDLAVNQDITGTATFAAGTTTAVAVDIDTLDDDVVEGDETFTVTLTEPRATPLPDGVNFGTRTATATITDNDMATVSIAPEADSQTEGDPFAFQVRLSKAVDAAVRVTWTAIAETAAVQDPNSDLAVNQDITGTATFAAGTTTAVAIDIATLDDDVVEGDETFTVTLTEPRATPLPDGVNFGTRTATATITDNDMATVSIAPEADSQTEGDPFAFEVRLSKAVDAAVRVTWTAIADTAAVRDPNSDLAVNQDITGTATFAAGTTTAVAVDIDTLDDDVVEGDETFTVTLTEPRATPLPDGVEFGTKTATATITDNDMATVSIAPEADTQAEGDPFAFEVRLSKAVDAAVRVTWTAIADTAAVQDPNSDLAVNQDITGTATFAAGTTTAVAVDIDTLDDDVVEGDETFTVTLTEPRATPLPDGVRFGDQTATATITDNDMATVSIAPAEASAAEGNPVNFTVQLSQAVNEAITVTWTAAAGTGASPATVSGPGSDLGPNQDITGTAFFPAGTTTAVDVAITTTNDAIVEGAETFTVTLTSATPLPDGVTFGTQAATATITEDETATVSIAPAEASAAEGNPFTFTVTLSRAAGRAVVLDVGYAPGVTNPVTLADDLDSDRPDTVTIAAGELSASFKVPITNDDRVEGDETFIVTLTAPDDLLGGVMIDDNNKSSTATITDSDMATVSMTPANLSATEGGSFSFTVNLSAPVSEDVNLTWTATGGPGDQEHDAEATVLIDLEESTDTLTIPKGSTNATFTIRSVDDELFEFDERFRVRLTANGELPDGVEIDPRARTSSPVIRDNDEDRHQIVLVPEFSTAVSAGRTGINRVGFRLHRGNTGDEPLIVNVVPKNGTAIAGEDFRAPSRQIIVPAHTSAFTGFVNFITIDDSITEILDEIFTAEYVGVSSHNVGFLNGDELPDFSIRDDDSTRVSLSRPASAVEGGMIVFTVELDKPVAKPFELAWTATDGPATGTPLADAATVADDLGKQSGTVTVTALSRTATISIPVANDAATEEDENFTVTLTGIDGLDEPGARFGIGRDRVTIDPNANSAIGTIPTNDETLIAFFGSLNSMPRTAIVEGDQGSTSVQWAVARDPVLSLRAGEFSWSTVGGTAAADEDFVAVSNRPETLPFGSAGLFRDFQVRGDTIVEADETFRLEFKPASADFPFKLLPDGTRRDNLSVTITDDDNAVVSLQPAAAAGEGDGTITFTVELDNPVAEQFSLAWTATDGTAMVADDLGEQSGTVTIPALSRTATFTIAVTDDEAVEPTETFTARLSGEAAGLVNIDPGKITINQSARDATGTIADNDGATVSISPSRAAVVEGGTFTFRVTLGEPVAEDVTVAWTAAGSGGNAATLTGPGSDLADDQDISGTVTIRANTTTEQTITIATRNDTRDEGSETFTVTLSEPPATPLPDGVNLGTDSAQATATITDDDGDDVIVSIGPAQATVTEGDPFAFTVSLSRAPSSPVTVIWTAAGTGANAATLSGGNSDLGSGQDISDAVTFLANTTTTEQTIAIATRDDARVEADETFTVTLAPGGLPDGVRFGAAEAAATIADNDNATVSIGHASAAENAGPARFTVSLSQEVSRDVVLRVLYGAGSADPATDLGDDRPATVTITANTTSAILAVPLNDDEIVEGAETFTVTLSADNDNPLPDGVSIPGGTAAAVGTITEDDTATVAITQATAVAAEGSTFTFMAGLSGQVNEAVTVRWTAAGTGANPATVAGAGSDLADGQPATGTVTFTANDTAQRQFTITTRNDTRDEGSETFTVTLSQDTLGGNLLPDGVSIPSAGAAATATITDRESGSATVSIFPPAATRPEGNPFAFEIRLSRAAEDPVTVTWTAAGSGGNAATVTGDGSDLADGQDITDTVTFTAGDTAAKTVTIATIDDDRVEGAETFTVRLTGALPDGVEFATDRATATITEGDTATVSLSPLSPSAAEGGTFTFTATLSASVSEAVTVRWTAASGTAAVDGAGSDLASGQATTGTVEFPADSAANATQTFMIATNNDTRVEGSETFTVTLSEDTEGGNDLPDGVEISADDEATATITEDETATVSLSPLSPSAAEGGTFTFTATLSASVSEAVTVRWTAASGTATVDGAGSDLASGQATTGTVEFPADSAANATQTFTIATANDARVEGSETFTVTLSPDDDTALPDGVTVGDDDAATATITETDAATLSLSPLSPSAAEGGTFTFTATLSAPVSEAVTVRWTAASGTATVDGAGSDLASGQATTATVTFPADSAANATRTFTIATNNDTRVEGSETFTVTLSEDTEGGNALPDGVEIGADDEAAATITETDAATVSLSPLSPSATEGGTFTFTATLSASVSEAVTVRWTATSGTATVDGAGSDLASGQATTATVMFPADSAANATQTFTIATNNDDLVEGSETFTVTLSPDDDNALPDGVTVGDDDGATATITETDTATVSLSPLSPSVAEGGTFTFTATLSASVSEAVTVRWTAASGTATVDGAGSDLASGQATTGTVEFPADSAANATRTFTIATNDDTRVEGSETFTVTLGEDTEGGNALPDGVEIGADDEATATITETDAATVTLSPLSPSAAEGGTFTFTATLSAPVSEAVTVRWTAASGTATVDGAGSDLASGQDITATVTFAADSAANATQTFTITTANDTRVEGSETFTVTLSPDDDNALPDGVTVGADDEATATITEGDTATVSLSPLSPSEAEGGTFTFTATLSAPVSEAVTVRWTAASGTATVDGAGSDLTSGQATTATVEFPADSAANATQTFTIATANDTRVEGSETFTVTLSPDDDTALPDGVTVGDDDGATATITETDAATVSLSPLSPSVAEGGTFTFTATLSAPVSEAVTVRWTAASGTATVDGAGSDLASGQATTGTVEFPADSAANATRTFTIATANDTRVEGSETFTVTLSPDDDNALPDGVTVGADDEATATITEGDTATVSLSPLSPSEAEGGTFTFTATLSAPVSEAVTVRWTAASGTATVDGAGSDLASGQATTATVEFPADSAANATQTFTIATANDTRVEGSETFTVTLSPDDDNALPDGVTVGADDEATATITEGDTATVTLSPLSPSVAEGGTFTFTATLSAPVSEAVTVRWTAASGTATVDGAGSDLASGQATTATVEFPANSAANATQTFTIATANDTRVEGSETFTVTLSPDDDNALPDGVTVGADDEATATITEGDTATVTLSPLSPSVAEGGTFTFTATLSASVSEAVTVRWTAASGTATVDGAGSDLASGQATTATVEFPADSAANATQTFTIATANDTRVEGSETFAVTLSPDDDNALPDGVTVGADHEATATITEGDTATVSLSPPSPSVAEGGTFTFTATLSAPVSEAVTVRWTAASGTATVDGAGSDLASGQATTATVEFPANSAANATQTFTIATANDTRVEGSETFTVTLSPDDDNALPDGVTVGADDEATATITEGDTATVSLSPLSPSEAEGGTFTFTATLSAPVSEAVTVRWTAASGTATVDGAGSDLASGQDITATVEFPADSAANATRTFTIATNNDTRVEGSETFTVTLSEDTEGGNDLPDGVEIGADDEATATITEDDAATLSISDGEAAEGSPVAFAIDLSAASSEPVTVRWTATTAGGNGAATLEGAGSDLATGQVLTDTVEFAADDTTTKTVSLATVDDDLVEGDETFTVTLSADTVNSIPLPGGVDISTTAGAGTGTITDGDAATVNIADMMVAENVAGGEVGFTVTLSRAAGGDVLLDIAYAAAGSSNPVTLADDLGTSLRNTVMIAEGQTTATIPVPIIDDKIAEGAETFTVTVSENRDAPLPGGVTIANGEATGTITDNDEAQIYIDPRLIPGRFTDVEVAVEGNPITFGLVVLLVNDDDASFDLITTPEDISFTWTAIGSGDHPAVGGQDYAFDLSGTVTIRAGTQEVTFTVPTIDDDVAEHEETFRVRLTLSSDLPPNISVRPNTFLPPDRLQATGRIADNDDPVAVSIGNASAAEEDGTLTFPVTLSKTVNTELTIDYATADDTATGSDDYTAETSGSLTIAPNAAGGEITVAVNDDELVEGDETLTVMLTDVTRFHDISDDLLDRAIGLGIDIVVIDTTEDTATGTITDNDVATVSIAPEADSQTEGDPFAFEVRLSKAVDEAVNVTWTAVAGTAAVQDPNSDLAENQDITGTATFTAGTTTAVAVDIATLDDERVEGGETFTVTLTEPRATPLPDGVEFGDQTATATITDNDMATVTIAPEADSQTEGDPFAFEVRLSKAVDEAVNVTWTAVAGTAAVQDPNSDLAVNQDIAGTATFTAGTTTAVAVDIATLDDERVEGDETFTVTLTEPRATPLPEGVEFATSSATATITDNDMATVSIAPEADTQAEGDPFAFEVRLGKAVDEAVNVTWTAVAGTAVVRDPNSDLAVNQDITGTATFAAGTTTAVAVDIATLDDDVVEGDETFTVTLTEPRATPLPDGVEFGTRTATATITDNDMATVSIAPEVDSQAEGDPFAFEVRLNKAVDEAVNVTWTAVAGTAAVQDPDSDLAVGQDITGTATFAAGTTTAVAVDIDTLDDDVVEGDETFTVALTGTLPDGVDFGDQAATATITDNDNAMVNIGDADPVAEGAGPARFMVTLSQAAGSDVVLDVAYAAGSADLEDLGSSRPATVTIEADATEATLDVPIVDDGIVEGEETFTVTLTENTMPDGVLIADGSAIGTITSAREPSILIEPRRVGASTALRRHVSRFDSMTGTLVRNRLRGSGMHDLSFLANITGDSQDVTVSSQPFTGSWGAWIDGAWAGIDGNASGRQADIYGGVDYLGTDGNWLIGALIGYDLADLDIDEATFRSDTFHFGLYGGALLSEQLLFDGAFAYGVATPEVALGNISASYDAHRFTARGALTGDFGFEHGLEAGSVRVEPQLGLLYSSETLGAFTDSADGVAEREVLDLGRFSAGPRLTWDFDGGRLAGQVTGQVTGGARMQWDFLQLEDGVGGRVSGATDIGLRLELAPGVTFGIRGDVDGIGIMDDFRSFGGNIELTVRF